jgi:hypothetical protein
MIDYNEECQVELSPDKAGKPGKKPKMLQFCATVDESSYCFQRADFGEFCHIGKSENLPSRIHSFCSIV